MLIYYEAPQNGGARIAKEVIAKEVTVLVAPNDVYLCAGRPATLARPAGRLALQYIRNAPPQIALPPRGIFDIF